MKLNIRLIQEMTIAKFAEEHDLTMTVKEREVAKNSPDRFYANFDHCEIMENGCLIGAFGNGNTPKEAIQDYANEIQLKKIAVNAYKPDRRNIDVPRLIAK